MEATKDFATSTFRPATIEDQVIYSRAIEAVIWGMPAVNYDVMYQAMVRDVKGSYNQIVYWSGLSDWKNQMLTPNPDVIYVMPFFNTKEVGPVVLEIPPAEEGSITGTIIDCWQAALEDVGPAGVDKGRGGKYLILPPYYTAQPPENYIALPSYNYQGYALLRSILKSGSEDDLDKAVDYARRIKLYPLSQEAHPPKTKFLDAFDLIFDATIAYDIRFFESLNRMIQSEPWLSRDKIMVDMLKSIGIEKGKIFYPNQRTKEILEEAAHDAHAWLSARYEIGFKSYYDNSQWAFPALPEVTHTQATFFEKPDGYSVDERGILYYYAFSSIKHLGTGQFYLLTLRDKYGNFLQGSNSYKLTVPANAPVKQYWSATIYDRTTHTLIRNLPRPGRSSQSPGIQINADHTVDIYFSPEPPHGNESNWIPTSKSGSFEVVFRFYGPTKPLFEKTWKLPDIEKIS